jgi:thiol-disulfide isomerase/thioredoxin
VALRLTIAAFAVTFIFSWTPAEASAGEPSVLKLEDLSLKDLKGHTQVFRRDKARRYFVFVAVGTSCPIVRAYVPVLNRLNREWKKKGVDFFLINGSRHDDWKSFVAEFLEYKLDFPVLLDGKQELTRRLGFKVSSQAAVVDAETKQVVYRGAIDDQNSFDGRKPSVKNRYLNDVLAAALARKPLPFASSEAFGCAITFD